MPNMSYCRFENTLSDLQDCQEHINDDNLSESEAHCRMELVEVCHGIINEYMEDDEDDE